MTDATTMTSALGVVMILIAYFPTVGISGYFQAWFADKLGDDTGKKLGMQTVDPLVHTSLIGLGLLIYSQLTTGMAFGWGRRVPLNPTNIDEPYQELKRILLYFSGAIVHAVMIFAIVLVLGVSDGLGLFAKSSVPIQWFVQTLLMFNIYLLVLFLILGAIEFILSEFFNTHELFEKYGMAIQVGVIIAAFMVLSIVFPFLFNIVLMSVMFITNIVHVLVASIRG